MVADKKPLDETRIGIVGKGSISTSSSTDFFQKFMQHRFFLGVCLLALPFVVIMPALAQESVVRAVLFYSPSCPHCHQIMTEDLPPLLEVYGTQLEIVAVDTSHPDGQTLYLAAIEQFNIGTEHRGVPTLIVGDHVLVGSIEIPQQLPFLVDDFLASGGRDWPAIPGFAEALDRSDSGSASAAPAPIAQPPAATEAPLGSGAAPSSASVEAGSQPGPSTESGAVQDLVGANSIDALARFQQDIVGNSLSVFVLLGMLAVVAKVMLPTAKAANIPSQRAADNIARRAVPLLIFLGLVVSTYMTFVETTQTTAVCGPVGDCNTVQQSEYARLFGLIPMGIIGVVGYGALGFGWALAGRHRGQHQSRLRFLVPMMAFVGTLFSIYLTFLEPFVIGATCMWCLTSAVSISLILLLTAGSWRMSRSRVTSDMSQRSWEGIQTLTKDK